MTSVTVSKKEVHWQDDRSAGAWWNGPPDSWAAAGFTPGHYEGAGWVKPTIPEGTPRDLVERIEMGAWPPPPPPKLARLQVVLPPIKPDPVVSLRETILLCLQHKGLALSTSQQTAIMEETDTVKLTRLLVRAATATRAEEVFHPDAVELRQAVLTMLEGRRLDIPQELRQVIQHAPLERLLKMASKAGSCKRALDLAA